MFMMYAIWMMRAMAAWLLRRGGTADLRDSLQQGLTGCAATIRYAGRIRTNL